MDDPIPMKDGQTVQMVVDKVADKLGMQMSADLDDTALKDLFFIKRDDLQEYAGKISMEPDNMDHIVALRANPGKVQKAVKGLKRRLEDVQNSFSQYQTEQNELVLQGQVVEKGNYIFLIILSDESTAMEEEIMEILEIIEDAF